MNNSKGAARQIVTAALIAAAYVALTYISSALGIAYGSVQFRLSEALMVLPLFTPAAVSGLTIGCLIGNLGSPFGMLDIILGTLATFLASILVRFLGKAFGKSAPFISILPPVIFNALIVGLELAVFSPEGSYMAVFLLSAAQIALGEAVVYIVLGIPICFVIKRYKKFLFNE